MIKINATSTISSVTLTKNRKYLSVYLFYLVNTKLVDVFQNTLKLETAKPLVTCCFLGKKLLITISHPNHLVINQLQMKLGSISMELENFLIQKKVFTQSDILVVKLRFR